MKIAIAIKDFEAVSSHAGQTRQWLVYDRTNHRANQLLPAPRRVNLEKEQVLHAFEDNEAHPLDGIDLIVAASAGEALPDPRFDITTMLCKVRDLFSRH